MRRKILVETYGAVSKLCGYKIISETPSFAQKMSWNVFKLKSRDFSYTPYKVAYDTNFYSTSTYTRYYSNMLLTNATSSKQKNYLEIESEVEEIGAEDTDKHLKPEGNESKKRVKEVVIATEERDKADINPETTISKLLVNTGSKNIKPKATNSDGNKNTNSDDRSTGSGNGGDNKGGNDFFQLLFNFASVASAIASVIAIYIAKQTLQYETDKDVEKAIGDIESDLSKLVVKVGAFNREDMWKLGQVLDRINGNEDVKAYFSLKEKSSGALVHIDTISNLLYCTNKWASQYMLNHNGYGIDHVRNNIQNMDEIFFDFLHNFEGLLFKVNTKFNGMSQNERYVYIL